MKILVARLSGQLRATATVPANRLPAFLAVSRHTILHGSLPNSSENRQPTYCQIFGVVLGASARNSDPNTLVIAQRRNQMHHPRACLPGVRLTTNYRSLALGAVEIRFKLSSTTAGRPVFASVSMPINSLPLSSTTY